MIAELHGTFGYRYLMEIERLEDERRGYCMGGFRADDARELTDKELKYLLRQCGTKNGVWPSKITTFRHAYKSLQNAVKAIRSRLIKVGD